MKKIILISAIILSTSALLANVTIFSKHKVLKKDGQSVVKSCSYCHNSSTGLEKKKGQNYKSLYKKPTCAGAGCHK
jgi:cytochrome c2